MYWLWCDAYLRCTFCTKQREYTPHVPSSVQNTSLSVPQTVQKINRRGGTVIQGDGDWERGGTVICVLVTCFCKLGGRTRPTNPQVSPNLIAPLFVDLNECDWKDTVKADLWVQRAPGTHTGMCADNAYVQLWKLPGLFYLFCSVSVPLVPQKPSKYENKIYSNFIWLAMSNWKITNGLGGLMGESDRSNNSLITVCTEPSQLYLAKSSRFVLERSKSYMKLACERSCQKAPKKINKTLWMRSGVFAHEPHEVPTRTCYFFFHCLKLSLRFPAILLRHPLELRVRRQPCLFDLISGNDTS